MRLKLFVFAVVCLALASCIRFRSPVTFSRSSRPPAPMRLVIGPENYIGIVGQAVQYGAMLVVNEERSITCAPWYSSTNPEVATIDQNGLLKSRRPGRTMVTAACEDHAAATPATFQVQTAPIVPKRP
jgi:hypothetical protein